MSSKTFLGREPHRVDVARLPDSEGAASHKKQFIMKYILSAPTFTQAKHRILIHFGLIAFHKMVMLFDDLYPGKHMYTTVNLPATENIGEDLNDTIVYSNPFL